MEISLVFADVFLLEHLNHLNREAFVSLLVEHACVRRVSVSRASSMCLFAELLAFYDLNRCFL